MAVEATAGGGFIVTGEASIGLYRIVAAKSALSLYLKTGMRVNRHVSVTDLCDIISGVTGKTYKRSRKSYEQAYRDISAYLA